MNVIWGHLLILALLQIPDGPSENELVPLRPEEEPSSEPTVHPAADTEITEDVEAAIEKLAREKNEQGKKLLKKYKYPDALTVFREAYELSPENAEVVNNYGYVHALLGNVEDAKKYYEEAIALDPERAVAYLNYSDLLMESSPEDEKQLANSAALLVKAREIFGNSPKVILRQARLEVLRGHLVQGERFYKEYLVLQRPTEKLKLELGDFFRDMGKTDEAVEWYKSVKAEAVKPLADGRLWELEVEAQSVRVGWQGPEVSEKAERLANNARQLFNSRKYAQAEHLYLQALKNSPTYAGAMAGYGDLLYRTGRVREAEMSWLRALVIDRDNPALYAKLAQLYLTRKNTDQAGWAVVFLTRALELRPQWIDLELDLAMALRETGDPMGALSHVKIFLGRIAASSPKRQEAIKLKRALETLLPPEDLIDSGLDEAARAADGNMSPAMKEALQRAKAHLKRGNLNGAMVELRKLPESDRGPAVLNLEARILLGAGRSKEAQQVLWQSLQKKEKQPIIHEQLGLVFIEQGKLDNGRIHLERAEQLGYGGATYLLAKLDAGDLDDTLLAIFRDLARINALLTAKRRIELFLNNDTASIYRAEARELRQKLEQRFDAFKSLAALTIFSLLLFVFILFMRIWGGTNLSRLIAEYPDAGIQVQRILSAVRHEVLKHNTMMLVGLVDAIENGEDVSSRIAHFHKQMLGDGTGGVQARLQHYIDELVRIGDAHKKRLNLKRKDAATSPLIKGMALVRKNRSRLERYAMLSYASKSALKRDLKNASALLNIEGYEAVRDLLNKLRTLTVNEALIRDVYERCLLEPAFEGVSFAPVQLEMQLEESDSVNIAVPRAAFEDILTNLIRNAIQSSLVYTENIEEVELGLSVSTEVDMVTGIERVVMLVKDKSPKELTAEMLRGRYIEEGLGLTADLVTRYDGTLDVFDGTDGFEKAVAVKLPVASSGDDA
ncbi:MAG: tetratricopeptide repeat protein [Deltaproteobacteria bacterium]|nr:tetratricopeptide repeat protein [Deltaproteobacteria bacterium]